MDPAAGGDSPPDARSTHGDDADAGLRQVIWTYRSCSLAEPSLPSLKAFAMADPITIGAAVGWGLSAVGWLASPIITRVLNQGFAHLDFNSSEKLKILDTQVLQLQRVMEVVDEDTYRFRLEPLLNMLKSAFYEAEDILDLVEYQSLKKQIEDAKSNSSKKDLLRKKLRSFIPLSSLKDEESGMSKLKLEKSLKKIDSSISDSCKLLEQLDLPSVSNDNRIRATNSSSAVTTTGPPLRVIGRDQDRKRIIAMLHEKEDQYQANTVSGACYSVIGIHGIAGSGKSTLAQCVYYHEKMEGHFMVVMWIHVSQKFSLHSIYTEMLEGATHGKCKKLSSLNVLKESLEKELRGKRILLVLDDVWFKIDNWKDREELQRLISPLNVGKAGSRILVTSRTEAALVALGAIKERCLPISELNEEVFLEMFKHYALRDARVGDKDQRTLEMLGEDIAKKLKRSPLAARTVGSRLHDNLDVDFWRSEKNRDLLNSTMGALWWSYQYLDEQVRRCFAYCSIFPRGYHFKRDELVKLWVAEGFIKTSKPEEEMEDVAKNYFNELLSASFLQLGGKEDVDYFIIHDLLCDLAGEVAGRDCFRIEEDFTEEVPKDVRYLFVVSYNREMLIEKISGLQNLRSLIIGDDIWLEGTEYKLFASMFTKLTELQKLRVLKIRVRAIDLKDTFSFSFPDSIAKWKHLRYLAFKVFGFRSPFTVTLPGSFTKLYHMQVVDFGRYADVLVIPEDTVNLVNLRHVIEVRFDLPNIGMMTLLDRLPYFTIRKKRGYEPRQLKHLNRLQGKLHIKGIDIIQSKKEALEINLAGKEKLTALVLEWDNATYGDPDVHAEVLEGLCPSKYLERLDINGYNGIKLPNWMTGEHNGCPKNMQEITFSTWSQQGLAPDLGAFIHLHSLYVSLCFWDALAGMEHLTSLKKLEFFGCYNLRSLGTLPKSLEKFTVECCNPELERLCNDYWSKSRQKWSTSWKIGALFRSPAKSSGVYWVLISVATVASSFGVRHLLCWFWRG